MRRSSEYELRLSPLFTSTHRVKLPWTGFAGTVTPVGRERFNHRLRFGSKAGMLAMTRRKQGLTRRDGGRPIYWQTLGLYSSLVGCRKAVDPVARKDPGVALGGFAAWLLKQGSGASASGPCWFCGSMSNRSSEWIVVHLVFRVGEPHNPRKPLHHTPNSLRTTSLRICGLT